MKKAFNSYYGGKEGDGSYQKIISILPPHDIYIEPFLGNGAIYRYKKPATLASIGIDLDAQVISKWNTLDTKGIYLINSDSVLWLENFQIPAAILKKIGTSVLIYIDPPYPMESRKSQKDRYKHEMDIPGHTKLLTVARGINANIVISSYPNPLYDEMLKDWNYFVFQAQTRSGTATEKVWYNYPTPDELHDYRYLGADYRERERIKGIITRGTSKFIQMPAVERNAFIENLKQQNIL